MRWHLEALRYLIATYGWGANNHEASHSRKGRNHLDADVSTERPTKHDGLGHPQFVEQLDCGLRKSGSRVGARRIDRIAGLPMPRQIERNEAMILRDLPLHLIAENATTKRIAMDQQHWYAALAALLNCEGTVRCGYHALPSRLDDHTVAISASTLRTSPGSSSAANGLSKCRTSDINFQTAGSRVAIRVRASCEFNRCSKSTGRSPRVWG